MPPRPYLLDGLARFDLHPGTGPAAPATDEAPPGAVFGVPSLAVPWNVAATRFGVPVVFTADTLEVPEDLATVKLLIQHDDERPVGYAATAAVADDGLMMTFEVDTSHPRAAEATREVELKWRDGLSVGVELDAATQEAIWAAMWEAEPSAAPIPLGGTLREVSLCSVPQFNNARIGAGSPVLARFTTEGSPAMPPTAPAPADPAPPTIIPGQHTPGEPAMSMAELASQLAPYLGATTAAHPLSVFANAGEFMLAARENRLTDEQRAAFALADQTTTNNPGVIPPAWLTDIVGIMDRGRPVVSAFGGPSSAGDSGMSINWPYYDGGYDGLVGEQVTEKSEVTTRRVDIKSASADLKTYAGASDISYQLLRRSSPSYREAYTRILGIAYSVTTDAVFAAAVAAAGADAAVDWDMTGDLATLLTALFSASSAVDDAVGTPADVVLAAPDVFMAIGILTGVVPAPGQVGGTSPTQASTLTVNVSGLHITKARALAAGTLLVSSSSAASWAEDGPRPVEGDDVAKLGLDVGIWGMGAPRITVPAGIVSVATGPALPLSDGAGTRSSRSGR
jgi:HK97 family phage prohead protease